MSILIKGMEMPKSRGEYELLLCIDSDGTATVEGSYCRFEGEPFEAIPVPPHGRLIDADDTENITVIVNENGSGFNRIIAPIIIEAEGET